MATLKSYSCSECGGVLNFDKDQELFGCPFCGADFAVGNIHRDELLKDVEIRLNNLEFHAAREKIDSILEQYPNDPLVLRDLVLCEGRCNSVDNLDHPGKMSSCDFVKLELFQKWNNFSSIIEFSLSNRSDRMTVRKRA